jgi:hypothetical protein
MCSLGLSGKSCVFVEQVERRVAAYENTPYVKNDLFSVLQVVSFLRTHSRFQFVTRQDPISVVSLK